MDKNKKYQSIPIPKRDNNTDVTDKKDVTIKGSFKLETNFATIDISIDRVESKAQNIPKKVANDEKRSKFYEMKQIAKRQMFDFIDNSQIFYEQGIFMQDFEDDFTGLEPFSYYYPHYQVMEYSQLRTYFTWRTKVKKGNITNTLLPYAYLYIYELINNIGVKDSREGLSKLIIFFKEFKKYNSTINSNVSRWIKDYFVYYQIEGTFYDFIASHDLLSLYAPTFRYELINANPFKYYASIAKYDIAASKFYLDGNAQYIEESFNYFYIKLREIFLAKGKIFEDFLFFSVARERSWAPFSNALFFPRLKHENIEIELSLGEKYACRYNQWYCSSATLSENGKHLATYLLKEAEAVMRQIKNYKRKITSNPHSCDTSMWQEFDDLGIDLKSLIKKYLHEYYRIQNIKPVNINLGALERIRDDALSVQEKLTIEEDITLPKAVVEKTETSETQKTNVDIWSEYKNSLDELELKVLSKVLRGENITEFLKEQNIMPQIPLDSINEKAMDIISDTILEVDDEIIVYDDYREKLLEMIDLDGK